MGLRFTTDRSLFDSFPTARKDVGIEPRDVAPTVLARTLALEGLMNEALSLCAYMLGRRQAIAWGCRSLRRLSTTPGDIATPAFRAAETWVERTTELHQAAARDVGAVASHDEPSTWMARAAGWSGGNLGPKVPHPVPPHLAAVGVRVGLILALHRLKPADRRERGRACVEDAIGVAEGEKQS